MWYFNNIYVILGNIVDSKAVIQQRLHYRWKSFIWILSDLTERQRTHNHFSSLVHVEKLLPFNSTAVCVCDYSASLGK